MRTKIIAALLAAIVPLVGEASTSIAIDAKRNCLAGAFGAVSGGAPVTFQLAPGRYVVSLLSNNMSCSGGVLTNGCMIHSVMLQGGLGTSSSRWGTSITEPTVVDLTGPGSLSNLIAYVSDDQCADNTGQATLLIQPAY